MQEGGENDKRIEIRCQAERNPTVNGGVTFLPDLVCQIWSIYNTHLISPFTFFDFSLYYYFPFLAPHLGFLISISIYLLFPKCFIFLLRHQNCWCSPKACRWLSLIRENHRGTILRIHDEKETDSLFFMTNQRGECSQSTFCTDVSVDKKCSWRRSLLRPLR